MAITIDPSTREAFSGPRNAHALGRLLGAASVGAGSLASSLMWDAGSALYGAVDDGSWASFVTGWNVGKDAVLYGITAPAIPEA